MTFEQFLCGPFATFEQVFDGRSLTAAELSIKTFGAARNGDHVVHALSSSSSFAGRGTRRSVVIVSHH